MAALAIARERAPEVPFIFVSGTLGEEVAIESLKLGATDYVLKQRLQRLPAAVRRALAEAAERTERRRAEAQQALLVAELSHRVKNTLATVTSIAHQTLRRSRTLEEFERAFMGRLRALADAHGLLLGARWDGASLRTLVQQSLRPFLGASTADLDGPEVLLDARTAMPLSMVLHELATNAARHGALRLPDGRLSVRWRTRATAAGPQLDLTWSERGDPPPAAPAREGFGTVLIRHSIAHELDGKVDLAFGEAGLVCTISMPLPATEARGRVADDAGGPRQPATAAGTGE